MSSKYWLKIVDSHLFGNKIYIESSSGDYIALNYPLEFKFKEDKSELEKSGIYPKNGDLILLQFSDSCYGLAWKRIDEKGNSIFENYGLRGGKDADVCFEDNSYHLINKSDYENETNCIICKKFLLEI